MELLGIIFTAFGVVIFAFIIIVVIGKISAKRKKVTTPAIKKKLEKIKNTETKVASKPKKDEFDLNPPKKEEKTQPLPPPQQFVEPIRHKGDKTMVEELTDEERHALGAVQEDSLINEAKESMPKRRSIEEILRARQANKSREVAKAEPQEEDDDFDKFRAEHSSYIPYQSDESLIDQIKNLSPEMKAVVFSSIFKRVDHE